MVTTNPDRVRMITRIKEDLRKKALQISPDTIETILDAYDKRIEKLAAKQGLQQLGVA